MWIEGMPVVHMVDKATHFCAARCVGRQTVTDIWKSIRLMWTFLYFGPPDYLDMDQGSNYKSREFKAGAAAEGIIMLEAPIETRGNWHGVEVTCSITTGVCVNQVQYSKGKFKRCISDHGSICKKHIDWTRRPLPYAPSLRRHSPPRGHYTRTYPTCMIGSNRPSATIIIEVNGKAANCLRLKTL